MTNPSRQDDELISAQLRIPVNNAVFLRPRGGGAPGVGFGRRRAGNLDWREPNGLADLKEAVIDERVSREEIEAEDAVSLPNEEALSLLDVNANVDLGLDLAAPVDLAAAANLNVAAPIEAAATANVLSPGAEAVGLAHQQGSIVENDSGSAVATAPQHAVVDQTANGGAGGAGGASTGTPAAGGAEAALGHACAGRWRRRRSTISQNLDHVRSEATATQDANVQQQ